GAPDDDRRCRASHPARAAVLPPGCRPAEGGPDPGRDPRARGARPPGGPRVDRAAPQRSRGAAPRRRARALARGRRAARRDGGPRGPREQPRRSRLCRVAARRHPRARRRRDGRLLEAHVDAAPRFIVREEPLVATTLGVLGEQDCAGSEREPLAEPRLELQCPTEGDHVLANRGTMPSQVRARRALLEAHLGRMPGPGSMCGSLELRELQSTLLELRIAVVVVVQTELWKRYRYLCRD